MRTKHITVLVVAIVATFIAFFLVLTMAGCSTNTDEFYYENGRFSSSGKDVGISIITDKQTGVQYIFAKSGYGAGLSPLLNEDGTPYIEKEQ